MGRISLLGTGNIAFSGNEIYSTNGNDLLIANNLTPTTNSFSIGSSANPIADVYVSANSIFLAPISAGNPPLALTNQDNNFNVVNAGLRSTVIYTGGLLLSANNIGADPAVSPQPMTIGTNGLPSVDFLAPLSAQSNTYLSNTSATNAFIGVLTTGMRTVSAVSAINVDFFF
jgi:hypothetical protein